MRQGLVFCNDIVAGIITEDERGYSFVYDKTYLSLPDVQPVSLTLPLRQEAYTNNVMFSFFDGLIPEGWMLNIAERNWKINRRDRMGRFTVLRDKWFACIDDSFISEQQKAQFKELISKRLATLNK